MILMARVALPIQELLLDVAGLLACNVIKNDLLQAHFSRIFNTHGERIHCKTDLFRTHFCRVPLNNYLLATLQNNVRM